MKPNHNQTLSPELKEKLSRIRHLALDMDGTIYMGTTLFPFTIGFLAEMKANGIGYSFLTNNPSKSVADYLKKLEGLGIEADEDNMYTTSLAAIDYIKAHYPSARRLFLLGTPSMISQFEKAGFESCADDPDDVPDCGSIRYDIGILKALPCCMVGIPGHPIHRDQSGPCLPYGPEDRACGLRFHLQVHRACHRPTAGHHPRKA